MLTFGQKKNLVCMYAHRAVLMFSSSAQWHLNFAFGQFSFHRNLILGILNFTGLSTGLTSIFLRAQP